jgi:hypothetical protein
VARTDAALIERELRAGKARAVTAPQLVSEGYRLEVKIISEGQVHTWRRRIDGGWCRFTNPLCVGSLNLKNLKDEEIEAALKSIDPKTLGPGKSGESLKLIAAAGKLPPLELPNIVEEAMTRLRKRGIKGLPPAEYGVALHAEVSAVLKETLGEVPKSWVVGSERRMSSLIKLDPATAKLTVREYMKKWGMADRYPALPDKFLETPIGGVEARRVRARTGRAHASLGSHVETGCCAPGEGHVLFRVDRPGDCRLHPHIRGYWRKVF